MIVSDEHLSHADLFQEAGEPLVALVLSFVFGLSIEIGG